MGRGTEFTPDTLKWIIRTTLISIFNQQHQMRSLDGRPSEKTCISLSTRRKIVSGGRLTYTFEDERVTVSGGGGSSHAGSSSTVSLTDRSGKRTEFKFKSWLGPGLRFYQLLLLLCGGLSNQPCSSCCMRAGLRASMAFTQFQLDVSLPLCPVR